MPKNSGSTVNSNITSTSASSELKEEEIDTLVRLYGIHYDKVNSEIRFSSPFRYDLEEEDWKRLQKEFVKETGINRSEKTLTDCWKQLECRYLDTIDDMRMAGIKGGPRDGINGKIHEILKDDPVVSPPCTFSSFSGKLVTNKRKLCPVKGMVVDDDEELNAEETPDENEPPAAKVPRRSSCDIIPESRQETEKD